jgi:NAD(P)-dependent dehydrogenase (short-subunit alcohol dehydrogenase family)
MNEPVINEAVVLVGGAASGLGAAVAEAVEQRGWTAAAVDIRSSPARHSYVADISRRKEVEEMVAAVRADHGHIDAVVACAGVDSPAPFAELPGDAWDRVIAVNLIGTANLVRAALPALLETHGQVVTVASTLGLRTLPDATAYCASKFGVVGFTRALTLELKGRVKVSLVVPGGMATAFFDDRSEQYRPGPDAKLNDPRNVAAAIMTVLSQPEGCEIRELVVTPSEETSWP